MFVINMYGNKKKLTAEIAKAKIAELNLLNALKEKETEAVILSNDGHWYYYSNNSIQKVDQSYTEVISASQKTILWTEVTHDQLNVAYCSKKFKSPHYLYNENNLSLFYYDADPVNPKVTEITVRHPYTAKDIKNYILTGNVHDHAVGNWGTKQLTSEQLEYITMRTGHSQNECIIVPRRHEDQLIKNKILNARVSSTIGWTSLGIGLLGFVIGGLLGGLIFAPYVFPAVAGGTFMAVLAIGTAGYLIGLALGFSSGAIMAYYKGMYKATVDFSSSLISFLPGRGHAKKTEELELQSPLHSDALFSSTQIVGTHEGNEITMELPDSLQNSG